MRIINGSIDMQIGSFRLSKRYDEFGVVKRINELACIFRKKISQ
jgi:hypothetical protein